MDLPSSKLFVYPVGMMTIGKRIRELRIDAKMTQEQLGGKFITDERPGGFGKQTVAAWESNRNAVTSDHLVRLCEIFNVSADYLLFGKIGIQSAIQDDESAWLKLKDMAERQLSKNKPLQKKMSVKK